MLLAELQQKQRKLADARATIENAIATYPEQCLPELSATQPELADVIKEMGHVAQAAEQTTPRERDT